MLGKNKNANIFFNTYRVGRTNMRAWLICNLNTELIHGYRGDLFTYYLSWSSGKKFVGVQFGDWWWAMATGDRACELAKHFSSSLSGLFLSKTWSRPCFSSSIDSVAWRVLKSLFAEVLDSRGLVFIILVPPLKPSLARLCCNCFWFVGVFGNSWIVSLF